MDDTDRRIIENEIAVPVGKAVSQWCKKNGITEPVVVSAVVSQPTCYIDESGVSHTGNLITVNCSILDDDEDYDDDDL